MDCSTLGFAFYMEHLASLKYIPRFSHYASACVHSAQQYLRGVYIAARRSPHLLCKRYQIKMRDYMDRRVTSPTWGRSPPCKEAPKIFFWKESFFQPLWFR